MGFASYAAYLKSALWTSIRARVLARDPNCYGCGKPAKQAHHRVYTKQALEGRDIRRMYSVCAGCHRRAEFRDCDGEKLNPVQATAKLAQMRRRSGLPMPEKPERSARERRRRRKATKPPPFVDNAQWRRDTQRLAEIQAGKR